MRISTFAAALLLPLFVAADTTTYTSTYTKTVTVKRVVATQTLTHGVNSTIASASGTAYSSGAAVIPLTTSVTSAPSSSTSATKTIPANFMGAANSLRSENAVYLGAVAAVVAALL